MKKGPLADRILYAFDNTLSRGPFGLITWLALISMVFILITAMIATLVGAKPDQFGFGGVFWTMLLQALAPNPVDFSAGPLSFLMAMLVITLGGLFMVSVFIGILTTSIEERILSLRRGRSKVVESGHTVILGWNAHIFLILRELIIAHASQRSSCIVVMGDIDKVEMEDQIQEKVGLTGHTHIVCRSGSPLDHTALEIVSINTASSIILLASDSDDPDPEVIKSLLAITNNPKRRPEPYHIVAEIHSSKNLEAARLVGGDETELVLINDVISRIIAQTSRQSGLSTVYTELLNFEGDEIYFKEEKELVGKTFGEALLAYEDSAVIGLRPRDGAPLLNPPMDTRLQIGDKIIAVSEDANTVIMNGRKDIQIQRDAIQLKEPTPLAPEQILILGWNKFGPEITSELDRYVAPGSRISVVAAAEDGLQNNAELVELQGQLKNVKVDFQVGNTSDRRLLERLSIPSYRHVIVLAYSEMLKTQLADSQTLVTLLHLRQIHMKADHKFSIVSEMRDSRNRELADITHADDFIVSEDLASLIMAQLSENVELLAVFTELFNKGGADIYVKPVSDYLRIDQPLNFYTVVEAARQRDEVAFGYRLSRYSGDPENNYGVVVNPDKSKSVQFSDSDRIIMLAGE